MRPRWPTAALAVAALLAVPACRAGDEAASIRPTPAAPSAPPAERFEPPARLCAAIPGEVVAEATGRSPVTVDGAGSQCSWRSPSPTAGGTDVVLQGTFIDTRSFEVGRPAGAAAPVAGLGDDAYVVRIGGAAPTTLYVRDGHQAFALWLDDASVPPAGAEGTLARLARQVLAG